MFLGYYMAYTALSCIMFLKAALPATKPAHGNDLVLFPDCITVLVIIFLRAGTPALDTPPFWSLILCP